MDWVAESVSKDTYVHIMEQYRPEFTVGKGEKRARSGFTKYEEIDRPVNDTEMQVVQVSGKIQETMKKTHRKTNLCIRPGQIFWGSKLPNTIVNFGPKGEWKQILSAIREYLTTTQELQSWLF